MARGGARRRCPAQGHARTLSVERDDMLARQHPRRERQEQRSQPDRADLSAMNLQEWFAALFVIFALAGCVQLATDQGQPPYSPSSGNNSEYPRDRGGDGGGG